MRGGPVSRLAPSARLLALALLMPGLFVAGDLPVLLLLLLALAALSSEGLRPRELARELPALLYLLGFLVLVQSLRLSGGPHLEGRALLEGLRYGLRLLAAFALGRLFYKSTSSSELREAALSLERLIPGALGRNLGLALSLVLGFVPGIVLEWRLSLEAGRARGIRGGTRPLLRLRVLEAFLRRLILSSLGLPELLAARGWTGQRLRGRAWTPASWLGTTAAATFSLLALLGLLPRGPWPGS